jgi:hypothetical protein
LRSGREEAPHLADQFTLQGYVLLEQFRLQPRELVMEVGDLVLRPVFLSGATPLHLLDFPGQAIVLVSEASHCRLQAPGRAQGVDPRREASETELGMAQLALPLIVLAFNLIQVLVLFATRAQELFVTVLCLVQHLADTAQKKVDVDRCDQSSPQGDSMR